MVDTEESIERQIPSNEPENNNENNEVDHNEQTTNTEGEIWIDLNESKNHNSSKLLQIVKNLQVELLSMKADNEQILKAQEELNHVLLNKIQGQEVSKEKELECDAGTTSYKRKSRKLNFSDNESNHSTDATVKRRKQKNNYSSVSSNNSPRRRKYKPYEELSGEFKKIKPPMFNGEVEKVEETEAWLSGMKKYFHIYNYYDRLKARMAIYNLTGKADIWWQDIKKVKNIKEK